MLQFCSVSNSPLIDNTFRNPFEPFQIKREVYFSKELCPLVFIVLNMFLHASAYEYVTLGVWFLSSSLYHERDRASQYLFCGFTIISWQFYFYLRISKDLKGCLSSLKSFTKQSFLLTFMACDKNWPFHILYEKYQNAWSENQNVSFSLAMELIDLLGFSQDFTNQFRISFLIRIIWVKLPNCYTFVIIMGHI